MSYLLIIKKRLNLITFLTPEKLKGKTKKQKDSACVLMGLVYFICAISTFLIYYLPSFSILACILILMSLILGCFYIYKIF